MSDSALSPSALYCVLYRSRAAPEFSALQGLPIITRFAQDYNARHQVTGMLLFSKNIFVQYLEGSQVAVLTLLEKIKQDSRHTNLVVLAKHPIGRRHYGVWSMESFDLREPAEAATARLDNLMRSHAHLKSVGKIATTRSTHAGELQSEIALQLLATFMTPPELN